MVQMSKDNNDIFFRPTEQCSIHIVCNKHLVVILYTIAYNHEKVTTSYKGSIKANVNCITVGGDDRVNFEGYQLRNIGTSTLIF